MSRAFAACIFCVLSSALAAANHDDIKVPGLPRDKLKQYLTGIADWIMTTGVGTNVLRNHSINPPSHIFINGNLARVLLAAHKIEPNQTYLEEGLKWCDTFVSLQVPSVTSSGDASGLWNTGYNEVFIADTGTAITALALCHSLQPNAAKRSLYEDAIEKFKLFVTEGCQQAPAIGSAKVSGVCPKKGKGWVIQSPDPDAGALGDGWYKNQLNYEPYTIATATTGSCGFVEYDVVLAAAGKPRQPELETIAVKAASWLVKNRTAEGLIPYTISPPTPHDHVVYQPISYSAESFIDVDLRYGGRPVPHGMTEKTVHDILTPLNSTCKWLVQNQSADGSWGNFDKFDTDDKSQLHVQFSADGDAQRSPRALSLLQWCYQRVEQTDAIKASIDKYVDFLLVESNSKAFGVNELALPTGFVGLAVADLIEPWVTFTPASNSHKAVSNMLV